MEDAQNPQKFPVISKQLRQNIAEAKAHIRKFAFADDREAFRCVALTALLYVVQMFVYPLLSTTALWSCGVVFSGLVTLRAIGNFHDLVHGSLFSVKAINSEVAMWFGAFTGINRGAWYQEHELMHHNKLGREDNIITADDSSTILATVKEWEAAPLWRRVLWRVLRHPLPFFTLWPTIVFLCGLTNPGKVPGLHLIVPSIPPYRLLKTPIIDRVLPAIVPVLQVMLGCWIFGPGYWPYFAVGRMMGYSLAFIMFHLEHAPAGVQMYFDISKGDYNMDIASYTSSTLLKIPSCLRWVLCGLEYHHIHHLNRKVPGYYLRTCHETAPPGTWDGIPYLDYKTAFQSLLTILYDEDEHCFRSFPEYEWLMPPVKPFAFSLLKAE